MARRSNLTTYDTNDIQSEIALLRRAQGDNPHSLIVACNDALMAGFTEIQTMAGWLNLAEWRDHWTLDSLRWQIPYSFENDKIVSVWHYSPLWPKREGKPGRFVWSLRRQVA